MPDVDRMDPTDRWGLIFHDLGLYHPAHSRQEWAQIADAIRTADLLHPSVTGVLGEDRLPVRGDTAWCQIAVDTYTRLHAAGAYWHLQSDDEPACYADESLIRGWLEAPWVPADDQPLTMAEVGGYDTAFARGRRPDPASVTMLVSAAQDAGVFGIPRHRVTLWRYSGDGTAAPHTFTITVRPPDTLGLSSGLIGADQLQLTPEDRPPVTAIVDLLAAVAGIANDLLAAAGAAPSPVAPLRRQRPQAPPPKPPGVDGFSIGIRGRPFQLLSGTSPDTQAATAPDIAATPFRTPRRPRT